MGGGIGMYSTTGCTTIVGAAVTITPVRASSAVAVVALSKAGASVVRRAAAALLVAAVIVMMKRTIAGTTVKRIALGSTLASAATIATMSLSAPAP